MDPRLFRRIIIGIIIFVIVIFVVYFLLFLRSNNPNSKLFTPSAPGENRLFPFNGGRRNANSEPETITQPTETEQGEVVIENSDEKLTKVTDFPVSGAIVLKSSKKVPVPIKEDQPASQVQQFIDKVIYFIRYNKKEDGHIYEQELGEKTAAQELTKTTIPNAEETYFSGDGNTIIYRYFSETGNTIETFVGVLPSRTTNGTICTLTFASDLSVGKSGEEVRALQLFLNITAGEKLGTDGSFGAGTKLAVERFQVAQKLPKTGIVDLATRTKLNALCAEIKAEETRKASEPVELHGSFLPENITGFTVSPDKRRMFYIAKLTEGIIGVTANIEGSQKTQIFSSSFTEWLPLWAQNNLITLTTKASSLVPGFSYSLDPVTKNFEKITGDINGLTTLASPNGEKVLLGEGGNTLGLSIYTIKTRTRGTLEIKTLPEKCVWANNSNLLYCGVPKTAEPKPYPDEWYQNIISFSDNIWSVDLVTGEMKIIAETKEDIDAIHLSLSNDEQILTFINKKTGELWALELN